jgi:hypothetical protein
LAAAWYCGEFMSIPVGIACALAGTAIPPARLRTAGLL